MGKWEERSEESSSSALQPIYPLELRESEGTSALRMCVCGDPSSERVEKVGKMGGLFGRPTFPSKE